MLAVKTITIVKNVKMDFMMDGTFHKPIFKELFQLIIRLVVLKGIIPKVTYHVKKLILQLTIIFPIPKLSYRLLLVTVYRQTSSLLLHLEQEPLIKDRLCA